MTEQKSRISTAVKIKMIVAVVLLSLVATLIWQNWVEVETNILWMTLPMPRPVLLLLMLLIGFVIGALTMRTYRRRR